MTRDRIEDAEGAGALIWTLICFIIWLVAIVAWIITFGPAWPV